MTRRSLDRQGPVLAACHETETVISIHACSGGMASKVDPAQGLHPLCVFFWCRGELRHRGQRILQTPESPIGSRPAHLHERGRTMYSTSPAGCTRRVKVALDPLGILKPKEVDMKRRHAEPERRRLIGQRLAR